MSTNINKNQDWWEEYFSVDGGWEKNGGREQTRIFSEHFTKRAIINPSAHFSLLDVGCALGDSIKHFSNFEDKVRKLAGHSSRLCILVPYNELKNGDPLRADIQEHHQRTFYRDSMDFLIREGVAKSISTSVFSCPGAWGWSFIDKVMQPIKNLMRPFLGREKVIEGHQILYDITILSQPHHS
jgi:hypothetical protein